jgi:hypothetical protein
VRLLSAAGWPSWSTCAIVSAGPPPASRIAAAPRHVRKVLTITGLDDTVILADTVDDATHLITNTRSASRHFVWRPRPGHAPQPAPALRARPSAPTIPGRARPDGWQKGFATADRGCANPSSMSSTSRRATGNPSRPLRYSRAPNPRLSGERHVEALGGEAGEGGADVEG